MALCLPAWAQPSPTLTLSSAIGQALGGSPALSSAQAALSAAQGNALQAAAFPNPEIGLEAENLAGNGDYRGTNAAEYTYNISQKLELGGKRTARRAVAQAESEATGKTLAATRLDITRSVTMAYGDILALQEKQKLAEVRETLAQEVFSNISQRVDTARDPLIYKNQAEVSLATARLENKKIQRDIQLAKRKLASHWGGTTVTGALDGTVLTSTTAPQPLDTYQAKLADTPEIQRHEDLRNAKAAALKLEKTQNIPDPSFSLGIRDFRETGHQAMVAGMSMPIPVFNRNQGNIARAVAEVAQAEQDAIQSRLASAQTLHEAWLEWQTAYTEARELETRIIPSAKQALTLSRQGFQRGRFSFLEVLNAQRTLAEAQEQHINALHSQLNARATVQRLTASNIPTGDQ